MEVMLRRECLDRLADQPVGRLAIVAGGRPEIFPVNYAMAGDTVVFRTADGTKLGGALNGPVAFEVDHTDPNHRSGWSVVIHGRAEAVDEFSSPTVAEAARAMPIDPWASFPKNHLVRIVPSSITGRRIAGDA